MRPTGPGYAALHEAAAWFDLSARGKIRATGEDRARLLHAMLSNEVLGLQPGQGNYHFLLDAQGHILADANLYVFPDSILLDLEPELKDRIFAHLYHHIIADDVQLEDVTGKLATIALEGPRSDQLAGIAVPAVPGSHEEAEGMIVARASATGQPGLSFLLDPACKADLIARLEDVGAVAATPEDVGTVRVENAVPRYGEDFRETTLPQETQQQARAVSFTKGCYLGQEIVERIRSRGQVHKLLVQLAIEGEEPPGQGSAVVAGAQEIGRLTSPVYSPRQGCSLGFAILRRDFAAPETTVLIDGRPGRVLR